MIRQVILAMNVMRKLRILPICIRKFCSRITVSITSVERRLTLTQGRVLKEMLEGAADGFGLFAGDGQMNATAVNHDVARLGNRR